MDLSSAPCSQRRMRQIGNSSTASIWNLVSTPRIGTSERKQSHQLFAVVDINTKVVAIEAGVGTGLTSSSDHWVLKLILSRDF
jgi:hypothetical protein